VSVSFGRTSHGSSKYIDAFIYQPFRNAQVRAPEIGSRKVDLSIESACPQIKKLAESLSVVDAYKELSCRRGTTSIIAAGLQHCTHAACPVPSDIIKAVEVASGLAVACDLAIHITKEG
jgi:hypothetical protein